MSKADEVVRDLRRIANDLPAITRASMADRQRVLAAIQALHSSATIHHACASVMAEGYDH